MNPLVLMYLKRELARLEHVKLCQLAKDIRRLQSETEPLRIAAAERYKAGRRGDGFVMRDTF